MKKKIDLTLTSCKHCPYLHDLNIGMKDLELPDYRCGKRMNMPITFENEFIVNHEGIIKGFPTWCPLEYDEDNLNSPNCIELYDVDLKVQIQARNSAEALTKSNYMVDNFNMIFNHLLGDVNAEFDGLKFHGKIRSLPLKNLDEE